MVGPYIVITGTIIKNEILHSQVWYGILKHRGKACVNRDLVEIPLQLGTWYDNYQMSGSLF